MRIVLGILFIAAGLNHFVNTAFYIGIMPPYIPFHRELVYITGVAEIVLGILVIVPRTAAPAAWGLILLMILMFPANLHMALHPDLFPRFRPLALYLRLPVQGLLIAWAYAYCRRVSTDDRR